MMHAALALPVLHKGIPLELYIPASHSFAAPLAIALIEGGVVTDTFFQGANRPLIEVFNEMDERELCIAALTSWWNSLKHRYSMQYFDWNLHVQQELGEFAHERHDDAPIIPTAWFCLTRSPNRDIPRVALARRVKELEARLEGFGQTVLAVLQDATRYLPEAFTPWRALDYAEWLHWEHSSSDDELITWRQQQDGITREEAEASVLTRKEFYGETPRWFMAPRRMRTRREIVRATRDEYTKSVVAACDAIAAFVNSPVFRLDSFTIGAHNTQLDSIDGFVVLRWDEDDRIAQAIDDALEMAGQSGEYCEYLDAIQIGLTGQALTGYLARMEQILRLAMLTEHLIFLLGDPL